jgi:hypothetical protein
MGIISTDDIAEIAGERQAHSLQARFALGYSFANTVAALAFAVSR